MTWGEEPHPTVSLQAAYRPTGLQAAYSEPTVCHSSLACPNPLELEVTGGWGGSPTQGSAEDQ